MFIYYCNYKNNKVQQTLEVRLPCDAGPSSALLLSRAGVYSGLSKYRLMYLSKWKSFELTVADKDMSSSVLFFTGSLEQTVKFLLSLPHGLCLGTNEELGEGSDCSSAIETKESEFHYSKSPGGLNVFRSIKKKEVKC